MSVTEREVSFEVAKDGSFPTAAEFERVWGALQDVDEFGLHRLVQRLAAPLVDAYERDERLEVTFADLGLLVAKTNNLAEWADYVRESVNKLEVIGREIATAVDCNGKVEHAPGVGRYGGEYEPSKEALERWGLAEPKADDA